MGRSPRGSGRPPSPGTMRRRSEGSLSEKSRRRRETLGKKSSQRKKTAREKASLPGTLDQITFEIRWLGGAIAKLRSLIDNQKTIPKNPEGPSPLTVPYETAAALSHTIQWDLWAPGQEMMTLTAKAQRAGGNLQELDKAASANDKWSSHGVLS
jgi:hypothetical protein